MPPEYHYPTHSTQYNGTSDLGPLNVADTESLFTLVPWPQPAAPGDPPILPPLYTLPGLPYNYVTTPQQKKLIANMPAVGSRPYGIAVCPLDYENQPVPLLADFRAIIFSVVGDYAMVRWTGTLWTVFETSGDTVVVIVPGQTFP